MAPIHRSKPARSRSYADVPSPPAEHLLSVPVQETRRRNVFGPLRFPHRLSSASCSAMAWSIGTTTPLTDSRRVPGCLPPSACGRSRFRPFGRPASSQNSAGNGSTAGRLREGPRFCQKPVASGTLQQTTEIVGTQNPCRIPVTRVTGRPRELRRLYELPLRRKEYTQARVERARVTVKS